MILPESPYAHLSTEQSVQALVTDLALMAAGRTSFCWKCCTTSRVIAGSVGVCGAFLSKVGMAYLCSHATVIGQ